MKRLVVCADGTWNERDALSEDGTRRPTNVLKVARSVLPQAADGTPQITFYLEGVGTGGGLDKYTGGAFGDGIEANVRALYRLIVYNYEPGDELYFFGFSRGAFTVRTLAGFMNKVGLIQKDDDYFVPEIYACYEKAHGPGSAGWDKAFRRVQGTRPCPIIRFIGVWDTVGALGAPGFLGQIFNRGKYKYHDIGLNPTIQNAFHALAIDERRKPFAPNLWKRPPGWGGQLQQAWFPGVHSNVGGSYSPDGLANEALHWLIEQAERLGLEFDPTYLRYYRPCFNSVLNDSMTAVYRAMGPYVRLVGQQLPDGEVLHQSVLDRIAHEASHYTPANVTDSLKSSGAVPVVNTSRVSRGEPC